MATTRRTRISLPPWGLGWACCVWTSPARSRPWSCPHGPVSCRSCVEGRRCDSDISDIAFSFSLALIPLFYGFHLAVFFVFFFVYLFRYFPLRYVPYMTSVTISTSFRCFNSFIAIDYNRRTCGLRGRSTWTTWS